MNATVYIATSLDGFIARENGELDWLHADRGASADEDYGYKAFMQTVDAIVIGRHTYETVRTFKTWPYGKPVVVLSSRMRDLPGELQASAELMSGEPAEILARLASMPLSADDAS